MTFDEFKSLNQDQLTMVSFYVSKKLSGKIFPTGIAQAVDLFTKLPTLMSAKYLTKTWPECIILFPMGLEERFDSAEFNKWKGTVDRNLKLSSDIQNFLLRNAADNKVKIGFHKLRNQQDIIDRLRLVGKTKWFFEDSRQFLRNTITRQLESYRLVADFVCIHGIHNGSEIFFNGLGAKVDGQMYLQSEVLFDIFEVTSDFIEMVKEIN